MEGNKLRKVPCVSGFSGNESDGNTSSGSGSDSPFPLLTVSQLSPNVTSSVCNASLSPMSPAAAPDIPSTSPPNKRDSSPRDSPGRWNEEEHLLFLKGLEIYGKSWKKISQIVKTRTVVQIRTHAQKYLIKIEKAKKLGLTGTVMMNGKAITSSTKGKGGAGGQKGLKAVTLPQVSFPSSVHTGIAKTHGSHKQRSKDHPVAPFSGPLSQAPGTQERLLEASSLMPGSVGAVNTYAAMCEDGGEAFYSAFSSGSSSGGATSSSACSSVTSSSAPHSPVVSGGEGEKGDGEEPRQSGSEFQDLEGFHHDHEYRQVEGEENPLDVDLACLFFNDEGHFHPDKAMEHSTLLLDPHPHLTLERQPQPPSQNLNYHGPQEPLESGMDQVMSRQPAIRQPSSHQQQQQQLLQEGKVLQGLPHQQLAPPQSACTPRLLPPLLSTVGSSSSITASLGGRPKQHQQQLQQLYLQQQQQQQHSQLKQEQPGQHVPEQAGNRDLHVRQQQQQEVQGYECQGRAQPPGDAREDRGLGIPGHHHNSSREHELLQPEPPVLDDFTQLNNAWLSHEGGAEACEDGKIMTHLKKGGGALLVGTAAASGGLSQGENPTSLSFMGQPQNAFQGGSVPCMGMLEPGPHDEDFLSRFMWEGEDTALTAVV